MLHGDNPYKAQIPYILVTNGGGVSEVDRAARLSKELQHPIQPHQVLQAHTVLQSLTKLYDDKPILVIGGPDKPPGGVRGIMNEYGFDDVYTAHDLHHSFPASWPFTRAAPDQVRSDLPDLSSVHFSAIIVFHDSRDWGRDIQLMVDILRSRDGVFGTESSPAELKKREQIPLYFSHGDLLWGNDFPVVRFGQGAFRVAFSNVWQKTTGLPLEYTVFGKPEKLTFEYAAEMLREMCGGQDPAKVYMVGDNPESDIRGGRDFGWETALVSKTGVYREAQGEPKYRPSFVVDDVEAAVREAIEREMGARRGE